MNATATKTNGRTNEQAREQTNEQANGKQAPRVRRSFDWVPEVLALVIVTPALVHGIASLKDLPIV